MRSKVAALAERLVLTRGFVRLEADLVKQIDVCRQSNDLDLVVKCLGLLGKCYSLESDPRAAEMFAEAASCARELYGENSLEEAEELEYLANELVATGDVARVEEIKLRALDIRETREKTRSGATAAGDGENAAAVDVESRYETLLRLNALYSLTKFYIDEKRFEESEIQFLKLLNGMKLHYGPISEEVEEFIPDYLEIQKGLGRTYDLKLSAHDNSERSDCTSENCYHGHPAEVRGILRRAEDARAKNNLQKSIGAYRDAVEKLQGFIDSESARLSDLDPFRELKIFQIARPQRFVQNILAQMLRRQWVMEQDEKLLTEAADILRKLVEVERVISDGTYLMLSLVDLCLIGSNYEDELAALSAELPPSTATLYTLALTSFRKNGATPQTRKAMRAALKQNPFVPMAVVSHNDESDLPYRLEEGSREEAAGYAIDASHQWRNTPGALPFMFKVFGIKLPPEACN